MMLYLGHSCIKPTDATFSKTRLTNRVVASLMLDIMHKYQINVRKCLVNEHFLTYASYEVDNKYICDVFAASY